MSSPISGFTAIPNPYMMPLLFLQSLLIGAGFGIGYQGERRKLSAMSNDKFNALDLGLHGFSEFKEILARNDFGQMLDLMHPLTDKLAVAFGELLKKFPELAGKVVSEATGTSFLGFGGAALTGGAHTGGGGDEFKTYLAYLKKLKEEGSSIDPEGTISLKLTDNEKFAGKWINYNSKIINWGFITFKEISFVLQLYADGKLPKVTKGMGKVILNKYNKLKPKKLTPTLIEEKSIIAIEKSGATGIIKEIATQYASIVKLAALIVKSGGTKKKKFIKLILAMGKKYNQFVAANGKPKLQLNTSLLMKGSVSPK